ncbi:MAG: ATP-dependent 6-phosphofructokinase [Acidobacteria bacterium]|nr:ATP-dependent 6-phosphofructokinase [Acidobacteriota bacterium]MCG3191533.1 ATP-dependent 6-phosphofructokinase 2 [Thermoanaerobaculia bacterium]MCK6681123.1 ATP-dependent 6-phosphofructokinase [Thermoanaerobaculia bacterium]
MTKYIGVLTAGGDSPGLNAALRGIGKAAIGRYGMQVLGFRDGFRGLMQNRTLWLDERTLSGILTIGGTILGTSRDKPHAMPVAGKTMDMTSLIVDHYHQHHLDAIVCLGGGGTAKNAFHLMKQGLNVITLPKTIDNDVAMTDSTIGFDTALGIATEAIDRLHSTAHSHHRIIVVEVMGHRAGWLALGAGVAGGADVILIPEIPYDIESVAEAILKRSRGEKRFSIVCVAEGAMSVKEAAEARRKTEEKLRTKTEDETAVPDGEKKKAGKKKAKDREKDKERDGRSREVESASSEGDGESNIGGALFLARKLEKLTGLESRVTILGHLQRGGTPSAADRFLATRLGIECANLIHRDHYGVMVAARGDGTEPVPLDQVAGKRKVVPLDHPWIEAARAVGTSLGG